MRGEVEIGASRGIMVLLVKQVHLQKEVGAVGERCISTSSQVGKEGVGGENVQAADVRVRRAEREREMKMVVGSMARVCWLGSEGGSWRTLVKYTLSSCATCQMTATWSLYS